MRNKLIIGNWKMNNGPQEGHNFLHELEELLSNKEIKHDFAIAPPAITMPYMMPHSHGDHKPFELPLAAQNFFCEEGGAYTGEHSVDFFAQLHVKYAILGHSERRTIFGESNETINKKIKLALKHFIQPVICFGETESEYENGKSKEIVEKQLREMLVDIKQDANKLIFAYEPIWAIGTGKTATAEYAQEMISFVREILKEFYGEESNEIRILYGGSVNPNNVEEIINQQDIDGALVGGASIKAEDFSNLLK